MSIDRSIYNEAIADQVANAADTYLVGSALRGTGNRLAARMRFRWRGWFTKTAAGVATPTFIVRVGTLGTVADAAQLTFTGPAQTAVVDTGFFTIDAILRDVDATAILDGICVLHHDLLDTGVAVRPSPVMHALATPGFDATVRDKYLGVSVNPGAAGVWTFQGVTAEVIMS